MKLTVPNSGFLELIGILSGLVCVCACTPASFAGQQTLESATPQTHTASSPTARMFDTAQHAADGLIAAAEKFDVDALTQIFGPEGHDIVLTGEFSQDRKHALLFAAAARQKHSVSVDPKSGTRAFLLVGEEDW